MGFTIEKAVKEKLPVKILLGGSSGSGKTFTALRLATGIIKKAGGGKIVLINTEGARGKLYANEFDYEIVDLENPRSPERYIEAIKFVISQGATVIIIDSLSHEWSWLNELVNNMPGNSFQNWGKVKPRHQKMSDAIIESPIHIIATGRGKDEYVMEDKNGKQTPKKVGVGVQQEKDTEYEYMVTFNLSQDTHIADVMKDNTHLFEGRYDILTEKDGEALYDWANNGTIVNRPSKEDLDNLRKEIIELAKSLGGSKDEKVVELCNTTIGGLNPNDCNNLDSLNKLIEELKKEQENRK